MCSSKSLLAIATLKKCAYIAPSAAGNVMTITCMPSGVGSKTTLASAV